MNSKKVILVISVLSFFSACTSYHSGPNTEVRNEKVGESSSVILPSGANTSTTSNTASSPRQIVRSKVAAGAVVFDARSDEEFQQGHYPNAINVPVDLLEPTLPALESYKDKQIIVYCKSGKRAELLKQGLNKAGFRNVYNAGGLKDIE